MTVPCASYMKGPFRMGADVHLHEGNVRGRPRGWIVYICVLALLLGFFLPGSIRAGVISSVAIDAGHGGEDPGCIGTHGTMEKEIALTLARRLADIIQERMGIEAVLVRRADYSMDPVERTGTANNRRSDLFISLHANSSFSPAQTGQIMVFVASPPEEDVAFEVSPVIPWDHVQARFRDESLRMGSLIVEEARKSGLWREGLVKEAPVLVLKGAAMPAVAVEVDFLSSSQGEDRFRDKWFQERICEALYRAIVRFDYTMERDPNGGTW